MLILGLAAGAISKLADIYCYEQFLGSSLSDMTSEFGIWILIGVVISLFSRSRPYAMINIFLFCAGMLASYYTTAEITHSVYGWTFIKGWSVFTVCTPVMAYLVTLTKDNGIFPFVIKIGIFIVYIILGTAGGFPKTHDVVILPALVYFLFIRKYDNSEKAYRKQ